MIDKETSMDALKNFVENFVKERDWSQFHSPKNISMALAIEASELMDIFKWDKEEDSKVKMSEGISRKEAIDELADIIIYAIAFANRNNIDISSAIEQKMKKNEKKYPVDQYKGHF
jgi:NTP pyrophosphatase (non-canonical NTP hydrolase)